MQHDSHEGKQTDFDSVAVPRTAPLSDHTGIDRNVTLRSWRRDTLPSSQVTNSWTRNARPCKENTSLCSPSCNVSRHRWIHRHSNQTTKYPYIFPRQIYIPSTSSLYPSKNSTASWLFDSMRHHRQNAGSSETRVTWWSTAYSPMLCLRRLP